MAQTPPTCEPKESIDKQVSDLNNGETFATVEITGKRAEWFGSAFTQVTSNPVPEGVDTYRIYNMGDVVLLTAYKNGCFLGAARIPLPLFMQVLKVSENNRVSND